MGARRSRYARVAKDESEILHSTLSDTSVEDLEEGRGYIHHDEDCGSRHLTLASPASFSKPPIAHDPLGGELNSKSNGTRRKRLLPWSFCRNGETASTEKTDCARCRKTRRPLRFILRCLGIALMILGLIEFIFLVVGFFPEDVDNASSRWRLSRPNVPTSHWPTDYTADIQTVQCHSHNDYWRPIPLKNAVEAGCTGVEADVWVLPDRTTDELFVGHSRSSLTTERTLKSLYVSPLLDILDSQNPVTTFHPDLDSPRNGVFDTDPSQTLVLLIDFKTDGQELWSYVSQQLEPLRQKKYLTYFNGSDTVTGPITVVATGNAPFNRVVENSEYRDIFFDAPLDLLADLASSQTNSSDKSQVKPSIYEELEVTTTESKAQGQGYSGSTPRNAAVYTAANSYYASVSFASSIGHALPFLTRTQKDNLRAQIQGAHKQGLKVRYWDTPSWPRGLRNYVWKTLVEEGVDYLNVDDLRGATRGDWGSPRRHHRWNIWNRR